MLTAGRTIADWLDGCAEAFDCMKGGTTDVEFDWFATDEKGHVAYLTTGGVLPIHHAVLRDKDAYLEACKFFFMLPSISPSHVVRPEHGNTADWAYFAERGLFAFDWSQQGGTNDRYVLIARPEQAASLRQAPAVVVDYVRRVALPVDLTRCDQIDRALLR